MNVLFINGYGRSGSTVIEGYLASNTDAVCVGELRNIWERSLKGYKCSCGDKILSCVFWSSILPDVFENIEHGIKRMVELRNKFDRIRLFNKAFQFTDLKEFKEYIAVYEKIYSKVLQVSGCKVVIDSSKNPTHAAILSFSKKINSQHLHLVRNPYAVVYSWKRKKLRKESPVEEYMPIHPALKSAMLWKVMNEQASKLGGLNFTLKYEDFVSEPEYYLEEISKFFSLNRKVNLVDMHTVGGNPVKFENQSLTIKEDEQWKSDLTYFDKIITKLITNKVAKNYDY